MATPREQTLDHLRIFVAVAEMESFTRASDSLSIPRGRASNVVRQLEQDVGARLLHRTTRRVRMTEDGRVFHARARALLADADSLRTMFAADQSGLTGRLRVDLPTEIARTIVVPALPDFLACHPELRLEMSSTDRQVDLVQEGFDLVLRIGPIGDETLVARRIGGLRMVNVASPAYVARRGLPTSLDDLRDGWHEIVHYGRTLGARPGGWEYLDAETGGYAALTLPGSLHVNSVQAYEAAGLAGIGLIQAGYSAMRSHLDSGRMVEVLPDLPPEPLDVSLVVAHRQNLTRRVRTFMTWLEGVLAPYLVR